MAVSEPLPSEAQRQQDLAAARKAVNKAFSRESQGTSGYHRKKICPACGQDRSGEHFILDICPHCFVSGVPCATGRSSD